MKSEIGLGQVTTILSAMSNLPLDVITEILSRLPVKLLSRYLCVSKQWYALIHSHAFINLHLRRSIESNTDRTLILHQQHATVPFDYFSVPFPNDDQFGKPMKIHHPPLPLCVNMSTQQIHGLVFVRSNKGELAIWNPLIRRYRKLPTLEKPFPSITIALGFGYDTREDDYKVLRVVQFLNRGFDVKMYSLKSKSWKNIKEQWPKKGWKRSSKSVSVNGALHWLVAENKQGPVMILAFDLANEKFQDFATPPRQPPTYGAERFLEACLEGFLEACLEVLNGKLCFIVNLEKKDNEVWLMEEYGEGSSWTRVYKIEYDGVFKNVKCFNPLMFSKNGKKILMEMCYSGRTFLIWFDTEIKTQRKVKIRKLPYVFQTAICTGSLLLLDGDNVDSRY
ncbi:F-box protein CPR1-like [Quercus suber]|uniref:F-box protein CPR1-like n=1 Tax=Quercus suber TaxID=58331 RepID=UPI0032DEDA75